MTFSTCAGCLGCVHTDVLLSERELKQAREKKSKRGIAVQMGSSSITLCCNEARTQRKAIESCRLAAMKRQRICPGCATWNAADLGTICFACQEGLGRARAAAARPSETVLWGVEWPEMGGTVSPALASNKNLTDALRGVAARLGALLVRAEGPGILGKDFLEVPHERWLPHGRRPYDFDRCGLVPMTEPQAQALREIMVSIANLAVDEYSRGRSAGSSLLLSMVQDDREVLKRIEEEERRVAALTQARRIESDA